MGKSHFAWGFGAAVTMAVVGCHVKVDRPKFVPSTGMASGPFTQLRSSDAIPTSNMPSYVEHASPMEWDENSITPDRLRGMSLQDCICEALTSSQLMRDLGVSVIRSPQSSITNLDPAIVFSDPRAGEEAALSAFDANLFASTNFESNDRAFNNGFFGNNGQLQQSLSTTQFGVSKRSATGGLYSLRNVTIYDRNNQQSNQLGPFSWDSFFEAQARQPLMLGAGTEFNRIAGPGAIPGQYNGVMIARVRTDISLIDFEKAVRDFVADVENAYWDLYYAYRDLESRMEVRKIAKDTADQTKNRLASSDKAGDYAQAKEQLLRFESEVIDSLNGRPIDGTRTNNGSVGGTFRGTGGVRVSERKLRLLIGAPINDGQLIHPTDKPLVAKMYFDWDSAIQQALHCREELRRQRWVIKQKELELIASRNFLKPQFDAITQYRMRGFDRTLQSPFNGQYQEWMVGLEYQTPIGFRKGFAAVRNAQLALSREAQVLHEQERAIHYGLSNAIAEAKRSYDNLRLQEQRLDEIVHQLQTIKNESDDKSALDVKLETHRRLLDARLRYHQAEVEYVLSIRNVNVEKGTLLPYCNVHLNESQATADIMSDAIHRVDAQDYYAVPKHRDLIIGQPNGKN